MVGAERDGTSEIPVPPAGHPGHGDNFQGRVSRAQLQDCFDTILARHENINEGKVKAVSGAKCQCAISVVSDKRSVTMFDQYFADQARQRFIVIYNQYVHCWKICIALCHVWILLFSNGAGSHPQRQPVL